MSTKIKVGDKVRQKYTFEPYRDIINTQTGTVVAVDLESEVYPVRVVFPHNGFNERPWRFDAEELELVSILAEESE